MYPSNTKLKIVFVASIVLLIGILVGYGVAIATIGEAVKVAKVAEVRVIDALGREVVFDGVPKRVVSTMPSITEMLFALGLDDKVIGVTTYCNYPQKVLEAVKRGAVSTIGDPWNLDLEKITTLKPDVVLLSISPHARLKEKFDELGLKVVFLKSNVAKDVYEVCADIRIIATIFNVMDRADRLIEDIEGKVREVTLKLVNAPKPRVLCLIGPPSWGLFSAGGDTFVGWLISTAGGANVAGAYSGWPMLSLEFIVAKNPNVIIIAAHGLNATDIYKEIAANVPDLMRTDAWRSGRVYLLMGEANDVLSRPGPRIANALTILAQLIHPEVFGELRRGDVVSVVGAAPLTALAIT